jgi:N-acetylneuraminate synthase
MKTFIIAEIGINHNGDVELAKQLIIGAKFAGVDAVKFQKRTIDKVYSREELEKYRESPWGTTNRQQKEGLELNEQEYDDINILCRDLKIPWFASPWDLESIEFLKKYNLPYNKIPSARLGHIPLVTAIATQGKYTFISTGMSTYDEIAEVIKIFKFYNCPFELMHCNSAYPANPSLLNLSMIPVLKGWFGCKVGYSGHEVGLTPSVVAVALGATSVERHICIERSMYGSDQAASVEVQGFRRLVDMIREAEVTIGDGNKTITPAELECRKKLWRTDDIKIS